jgi:hypothetical protein
MWHGGRGLPPWRWTAGLWHRAARPCRQRCTPAAVPHGGKDLMPWGVAAGLLPPCDKFLVRPFIFWKSKQKIYIKKILLNPHPLPAQARTLRFPPSLPSFGQSPTPQPKDLPLIKFLMCRQAGSHTYRVSLFLKLKLILIWLISIQSLF